MWDIIIYNKTKIYVYIYIYTYTHNQGLFSFAIFFGNQDAPKQLREVSLRRCRMHLAPLMQTHSPAKVFRHGRSILWSATNTQFTLEKRVWDKSKDIGLQLPMAWTSFWNLTLELLTPLLVLRFVCPWLYFLQHLQHTLELKLSSAWQKIWVSGSLLVDDFPSCLLIRIFIAHILKELRGVSHTAFPNQSLQKTLPTEEALLNPKKQTTKQT